VAFGASSARSIRVASSGLVIVIALASVAVVAAMAIDLMRARPVAPVALAQVSVLSAPRAADLVIARKSASTSRSVAQTAPANAPAQAPADATVSELQQRYEPVARAAAAKYDIDPNVFVRQITQESHWDPTTVSPSGAQGIAQFMPATAASRGVDPLDPIAALDAAAKLDHDNLIAFDGDYAEMLAAYNAGRGSVMRYGGVPPFPETQNYVALILTGPTTEPAGPPIP